MVRACPGITVASLGGEAPGWPGATSAQSGTLQAMSNAASRDASAARMPQLSPDRPLEPADESEEVLKIHEGTPAGRRQRRTNRVTADCFTEAVPERDMTRQPEVDPDV